MAKNTNLRNAKKAKNDEFFTQLSDIEREISHYDNAYFEDKVVLCNCNDGTDSKFWEYFHKNFKFKGLKKLIGISYALLAEDTEDRGKVYIYDGGTTTDSDMDLNICVEKELKGSGDFREEECIEYLKEADVVVTNPPFSLFREYVAQLIEYDKKFLIIGNQNVITYKEIFPLLRNNIIWLGYGFKGGNAYFSIPNYKQESNRFANGVYNSETGLVKFRNCVWFTNLDIQKRHEKLILYRNYTPEEYPCFDELPNVINVNKVDQIPVDCDGLMGVPITFLDKYNPEQFEIIDALNRYTILDYWGINDDVKSRHSHCCNINGKSTYYRIVIKRKVGK